MFSDYCSISALSCSLEFVGWWFPSDYLVSTQLQFWLFCCWGCGCCWAVTTATIRGLFWKIQNLRGDTKIFFQGIVTAKWVNFTLVYSFNNKIVTFILELQALLFLFREKISSLFFILLGYIRLLCHQLVNEKKDKLHYLRLMNKYLTPPGRSLSN